MYCWHGHSHVKTPKLGPMGYWQSHYPYKPGSRGKAKQESENLGKNVVLVVGSKDAFRREGEPAWVR